MDQSQNSHSLDTLQEEPDPKALLRLLEYCRYLGHSEEIQTIQSWQTFVNKFYSSEGRQKYILVNPTNSDSRAFEIPMSSLPKIYFTNYQSGVKEMKLTLDGTIEQPSRTPLILECNKVSLLSDYTCGSKVISVGTIRVIFGPDYKFELLEIKILDFTELIPRPKGDTSESPVIDSKTDSKKKSSSKKGSSSAVKNSGYIIPESVVNEFGISIKMMRALGISDIQSKMPELLQTTTDVTRRQSQDSVAPHAYQMLQNGLTPVKPDIPGLPAVSNTISSVPPSQASFVPYGTMPQADSSIALPGLSSPGIMKRRFSTSLGTNAGAIGLGTMQSPPMEAAQSGVNSTAGTPTLDYASVGGLTTHLNSVQGPGGPHAGFTSNTSSFTVPSTVPMAALSSPILPASNPNAAKSAKRAKNGSVASTPILSNKGPTPGSTITTTTTITTPAISGRNRKAANRKDSSAKRKGSLAGESTTTDSTAGSATPTISNATMTGSPTNKSTAQFRNRSSKNGSSPVSIPSPISTPMMSIALNDVQQVDANMNQTSGVPVSRGVPTRFEAMSPPFYSALVPNQNMLMPSSSVNNLDMDTTFQIPRTAMDETEEWSGSLDFMNDPKGLDMGEFIFDASYDKDSESTTGTTVLASTDSTGDAQISL
ncbi:hypothetical protein FBU30_001911 [Linnemannia zychae]|nr:hypothetical protein FBU30_001911 [Linnemannia zychae]